MKINFLSVNNQDGLIEGIKLFKLKVNRDSRGILMETFKTSWPEVFGPDLPFGQSYCSVTNPGFARDEDRWHYHPTKQTDRFVVVKGSAVFAIYDSRKDSKTRGHLNLFLMGDINGDKGHYLLVIPRNVLHGFCVVSREPCYLISYISTLYDPNEEGRISFTESGVVFPDGTPFSWKPVREQFISQK
ncbi:MAG: dTDP-4-dehydrorhamnose 3,5-epimerase family protein [Patescibacteria group bacterium]|nr:dTDP-4-dehydrorhamnose 3,5-epimerase family protein [Patescibacteria group bacterium]MCL5095393.1 dTDP-4-dehydrorhamnose 3,5-epimerase family protein [Patescibacteria group bacterium]